MSLHLSKISRIEIILHQRLGKETIYEVAEMDVDCLASLFDGRCVEDVGACFD